MKRKYKNKKCPSVVKLNRVVHGLGQPGRALKLGPIDKWAGIRLSGRKSEARPVPARMYFIPLVGVDLSKQKV